MTAKLPPRCAACLEPLTTAPRGHGKRFCGTACRVAAYRRRQQKVSEKAPRWDHARGRLRLSKAGAFDRRQAELAEARQQRAERRERYRRMDEERTAKRATWRRPPTRAELEAMTDEELLALAPRPRPPLTDDWMYRR